MRTVLNVALVAVTWRAIVAALVLVGFSAASIVDNAFRPRFALAE